MSGVDLLARGLAARAIGRADTLARGGVYNRSALTAWHAALANRTVSPARVVWLGDSITEGQGAASYGTRWVDRALAALRAAHPVAGVVGGVGYLPAMNYAAVLSIASEGNPYTARTGSPVWLGGFGLGGKGAAFNAAGDGLVFTASASSLDVWFVRTVGAGTLAIQIDGAPPTTIATASGSIGLTERWNSGALTSGIHTIALKSNGGGPVYVEGLTIFNGDEAAGIQGYEAGRATATAADFASDLTGQAFAAPALGLVQPYLVVLAFGTNDYGAQVTPALFKANVQSIIAAVRARVPAASIALLGYARRGDITPQPIGWEQYGRALFEVADADTGGLNGRSGVAVIDLAARLPDAAASGPADPLGLYHADRLHYGPAGHALVGEIVGAALSL